MKRNQQSIDNDTDDNMAYKHVEDVSPGTMLDNPLIIGLVKLLGRDVAYSPPMSVLCATID